MANDLVRWDWASDDSQREQNAENGAEQWDLPPEQPSWQGRVFGQTTLIRDTRAAAKADQDAAQARRRGDTGFAVLREADAAEHRQQKWDWGDGRTWLIIAGMCLGFLLFCLFVYVMPYSRHNQNDGPMPTPTIRVY